MSVFTYTATQALTSGVTANDVVTRQFRLLAYPRQYSPIAKRNTSISGEVESILRRREVRYSCVTELVEPRSAEELRLLEFLESTANSEVFTFDRYGTLAVPDNEVTCIMDSKGYTTSEVNKRYNQYRFVIREK